MTPEPPPAEPDRAVADALPVPQDAGQAAPQAAGGHTGQAGAQHAGHATPGQAGAPSPASPAELYESGGRSLDRGDAGQAAEAFTAALAQLGADDPARGQVLGALGIARLEQAVAAFTEAAQKGDRSVRPLALELLARTLPLRDRDDEAAQVWQAGTADPDPHVAAAVRTRLRRGVGTAAQAGQEFWWDGFLESAICHGTLAVLAGELFGALDHIYALVAVPYVRRARQRELWEALAQAVRVPNGYAWGPELQASFRHRLRDAVGADADVLPPGWPDQG